ncbi:MAG: NAD(P)H-hydrate dehydratase [Minisyncoccales bacterium]
MIKITKQILKKIYPPRPKEAKKYDFGLLLVIGGSDFYSGSPALSALAAFRAGVDMVRIIAPKRAADIIASFSPDLAAYPLDEKWLTKKSVSTLLAMTESAKAVSYGKIAVVIGGGLGRSRETQEAIREYLSQIDVPAVIDADAIHAVGQNQQIITGKNFLFTPHSYEFFVLTGRRVDKLSEAEKIKAVEEEAGRLKTTILLKGPVDIISNGQETAIDRAGSPYMTVGGCGDTLAGICGALLARGVNVFEAAQAGIYINDRAGERAANKLKEGLMATDLIEAIPEVIKN